MVLVGLGSPEQAEAFRQNFDLSFPIVCDPDRRLYAAYGLKQMGLWDFASPALLVKGVKALSQGHSMGLPTGDIYQRSGVFIIDPTGCIRYSYSARDPADHPSADTILEALATMEPQINTKPQIK